ncbi:MAG: hypothetical protein RIR97_777 [Pseudomonadota bacterium]
MPDGESQLFVSCDGLKRGMTKASGLSARRFSATTVRAVLCLSACLVLASHAFGDDDGDDDDNHNRDAVLSSVEKGEILPLSTIRKQISNAFPGDIVDVAIVRRHGAIRYRFKVLTQSGVLQEVIINAVDGTVLKVENHD